LLAAPRLSALKTMTENGDQTSASSNKHPCKNSNNWGFLALLENLLCIKISTKISEQRNIQFPSPKNGNE